MHHRAGVDEDEVVTLAVAEVVEGLGEVGAEIQAGLGRGRGHGPDEGEGGASGDDVEAGADVADRVQRLGVLQRHAQRPPPVPLDSEV